VVLRIATLDGIQPQALRELDGPVTTDGFARIAQACARGREDLAARGMNEQGRKELRLFSTWEITRYLIPVAQPHFRRVLRAAGAVAALQVGGRAIFVAAPADALGVLGMQGKTLGHGSRRRLNDG
jgi:hypothetical protein